MLDPLFMPKNVVYLDQWLTILPAATFGPLQGSQVQ